MAQNLFNKYVWLVETIRRAGEEGITFNEINEKWRRKDNQSLSEGVDLSKRTFHKWLEKAQQAFDINIECQRAGGYHYYIENPEQLKSAEMRNWLMNNIAVNNLLMQNTELKDRIQLEEIPSGQEFLPDIIEAMKDSHVLRLTYKPYWKVEAETFDVHPYCIKLFKQRWYLVAYRPSKQAVRTYGVDRIKEVTILPGNKFKMQGSFDPTAMFRDYYGVLIGSNPVQDITLKVASFQANYLRSLPLHHTQRETVRNDEYSIFTYRLCPEYDFMMELLSMGEEVEVLEPVLLRNQMAEVISAMNKKYC